MAVNLFSGFIVWVNGGFAGSIHDLTIATHRLVTRLLHGERVLADKGYRGNVIFLTPVQGKWDYLTLSQQAWNLVHTRLHWEHIERINKRLKQWRFLKHPWRHGVSRHHLAFYVAAKLTNVSLVFHPLNAA